MKKIKLLCFSLNRSQQLDLFLRSVEKNAPNLFDITILYKATSWDSLDGYNLLSKRIGAGEFPSVTKLREETGFRSNVENELDTDHELFAFATDDSIVYSNLKELTVNDPYQEIDDALIYADVLCYSLRLGGNIKYENYYGGNRVNCPDFMFQQRTLFWDWKRVGHSCFGYPLSVDMHVFRTDTIKAIVKRAKFDTPNSLEGNMASFAHTLPQHLMACPSQSVVFGNSCNRTQNVWQNHCGSKYPYSIEELNQKYLDGYIVDLDNLDFSSINSIHGEVELKFVKR